MNGAALNRHLNVFDPYRDLPRHHEDQLTRAAMIVLRLVPPARDAFLAAIGEPAQDALPACELDMQATHVVAGGAEADELTADDESAAEGDGADAADADDGEPDAAAEPEDEVPVEAAAGDVPQLRRLVSVFLTPDEEPLALAKDVTPSDRGQRLDGVLRFGSELAIVVESKIDDKWARRSEHLVAQLNLHGVAVEESRTCVLPWHDLFESWWQLAESGALSLAERGLVEDLIALADDEFAHVLPFGSLRRAGRERTRRRRRLRALLHEATGVEPEGSGTLLHVRLDWAGGVQSLQRAALEILDDDASLALRFWPGELKSQAEHLYADGRAERLAAFEGLDGWSVEPQPHFGFRNARPQARLYLQCDLDVVEYARRWQGEDWPKVGAHQGPALQGELFEWLVERGYAVPADAAGVDPFLHALGRRLAHLRPGMRITRRWALEEAEELDDAGLLAGALQDAINLVLDTLGEPLVPIPAKAAAARRKAGVAQRRKVRQAAAKAAQTKAKARAKAAKAKKAKAKPAASGPAKRRSTPAQADPGEANAA